MSSHHRRPIIVAPSSPPATPPEASGYQFQNGRHNPHASSRPRAIVERSKFAVVSAAPRVLRRQSSQQSRSSRSSQRSSEQPSSGPMFKFDEDLPGFADSPGNRHQDAQPRSYGRMRDRRQTVMKNSSSSESLTSDERPSRPDHRAEASASGTRHSGTNRRSSTHESSRIDRHGKRNGSKSSKRQMATSAPILIPSRGNDTQRRVLGPTSSYRRPTSNQHSRSAHSAGTRYLQQRSISSSSSESDYG